MDFPKGRATDMASCSLRQHVYTHVTLFPPDCPGRPPSCWMSGTAPSLLTELNSTDLPATFPAKVALVFTPCKEITMVPGGGGGFPTSRPKT